MPIAGLIDIPIDEGQIGGKKRMVLRPNVEKRKHSKTSHRAITKFRVS